MTTADHVGQYVGRYFVEECIGHGAVATVYRVRHARLGGSFALKVLHTESDKMRERLMQEGRAQCELRHQNVVAVSDLLYVDGDPGLVMEYVDGPDLGQWLQSHSPSVEEAIQLFRGIVRGVAYAHREGWVHRDLKPTNVLIAKSEDGLRPKVLDFGLVKVLGDDPSGAKGGTGMALGTPAYMAPEQIRNADTVDHRADLFSLGCILYELVCGQRAFVGSGTMNVLNKIVQGDYVKPTEIVPGLPQPVEALIADLLQVKARNRLGSCDELLARLNDRALLGERARRRPSGSSITRIWVVTLGVVLSLMMIAVVAVDMVVNLQPTVEVRDAMVIIQPAIQVAPREPKAPPPEPEPPPIPVRAPTPASAPAPVAPAPTTDNPWGVADAPEKPPNLPPGPRSVWDTDDAPTGPPSATVSTTGDARSVWLIAGRSQFSTTDKIPPGTYGIVAQFTGPEWINAGKLKVKADEAIALHCDGGTQRCKQ